MSPRRICSWGLLCLATLLGRTEQGGIRGAPPLAAVVSWTALDVGTCWHLGQEWWFRIASAREEVLQLEAPQVLGCNCLEASWWGTAGTRARIGAGQVADLRLRIGHAPEVGPFGARLLLRAADPAGDRVVALRGVRRRPGPLQDLESRGLPRVVMGSRQPLVVRWDDALEHWPVDVEPLAGSSPCAWWLPIAAIGTGHGRELHLLPLVPWRPQCAYQVRSRFAVDGGAIQDTPLNLIAVPIFSATAACHASGRTLEVRLQSSAPVDAEATIRVRDNLGTMLESRDVRVPALGHLVVQIPMSHPGAAAAVEVASDRPAEFHRTLPLGPGFRPAALGGTRGR